MSLSGSDGTTSFKPPLLHGSQQVRKFRHQLAASMHVSVPYPPRVIYHLPNVHIASLEAEIHLQHPTKHICSDCPGSSTTSSFTICQWNSPRNLRTIPPTDKRRSSSKPVQGIIYKLGVVYTSSCVRTRPTNVIVSRTSLLS